MWWPPEKRNGKLLGDRYLLSFPSLDAAHVALLSAPQPVTPYSFALSRCLGLPSPLPPNPIAPSARYVPAMPERILDLPGIADDYYCSVLDWGARLLAVALGAELYLWDPAGGRSAEFARGTAPPPITSVSWARSGAALAVGAGGGKVEVWDVEAGAPVFRVEAPERRRIGSLAWGVALLASGSQDGGIALHDLRSRRPASYLRGHTQEVCGLAWSAGPAALFGDLEGRLASGGNDNCVGVWEPGHLAARPLFFEPEAHGAAVKAISWCPWRPDLLATGGGTGDGQIKFWEGGRCAKAKGTDGGHQITALRWSPAPYREIATAHGYGSQNQITVWSCPSMEKSRELLGHTGRVLSLAEHAGVLASASADETLRFWNLWPPPSPPRTGRNSSRRSAPMMRPRDLR